jgi:protein-disulfide isomerase
VAVVAVLAVILLGGEGGSPPEGEGQAPQATTRGGGSPGSDAGGPVLEHPALGDAGAPVVMVEYSDYQ